MSLTAERRKAVELHLARNFEAYAQRILRILPKTGGAPVPFILNDAQRHLHRKIEEQRASIGKVRAIVLKGRQQGISTEVEGRFYWRITHSRGKRAFILTHEQKATDNLFGMVSRFYENAPFDARPHLGASNAKELVFDRLDCKYTIATAGARGTGRSATAQFFHGCLAAGTPVVDGVTGRLRAIESMRQGDAVRTHTGQQAPITFATTQTKPCIEVVMRGLRDFPLYCTREHRFYTRRGWLTGGELQVGDQIGYPVCELGSAPMSLPFAIPIAERPQGGGAEHRAPEWAEADEALGRVVGLYLAEGCIKRQWKTDSPSGVVFTMHEAEVGRNAAWVDACNPLFSSMSARPRADSKTVTLDVYGKAFATRILEWCGELDDKHLPTWWRNAPRDFVLGMVKGYLCGDGHFSATRDRRISATSIRSALTVGMRDAVASLGFGWAGIEYKAAGIRHGRDEREAWVLRLCGAGVEALSALCGKPFVPRQRISAEYGGAVVSQGYAWVPIVEIAEAGDREVYEFEIGHADHSYCILQGATHNSEVAFWPDAANHLAGIGQTLPDEVGTESILESTANGTANVFHELWQAAVRGESEYLPVFIPWVWQREYRRSAPSGFELDEQDIDYQETYGLDIEQMAWRANKIATDFRGDTSLFDQEYPASAELAFASSSPRALLPVLLVSAARRVRDVEAIGPLIMGVDPAEYGSDYTSVWLRRGRVAWRVGKWNGLGPMETVGKVGLLIEKFHPDRVFVDATNSAGISDRLKEEGYPVQRVHFGEAAVDDKLYVLRRDELWGDMLDWFQDKPASIPDEDDVSAQLTSVQYSYDSKRRKKLESKEQMFKRGLKSPDDADAIALTFTKGGVSGAANAQAFKGRKRYS